MSTGMYNMKFLVTSLTFFHFNFNYFVQTNHFILKILKIATKIYLFSLTSSQINSTYIRPLNSSFKKIIPKRLLQLYMEKQKFDYEVFCALDELFSFILSWLCACLSQKLFPFYVNFLSSPMQYFGLCWKFKFMLVHIRQIHKMEASNFHIFPILTEHSLELWILRVHEVNWANLIHIFGLIYRVKCA